MYFQTLSKNLDLSAIQEVIEDLRSMSNSPNFEGDSGFGKISLFSLRKVLDFPTGGEDNLSEEKDDQSQTR